MTRLIERWNRFWFEPVHPSTLGFCRLIFFAGVLCLQLPLAKHEWARVPMMFYQPIWPFRLFRIPVFSESTLMVLEIIWVIVLVLAAAGLFTRVAVASAFLLSIYLMALPSNYGKVGHGDQVIVLTMLVLALARCGDAWSIDARRRTTGKTAALPILSGEYRWPIRMIWLLMAVVFCAAGMTKLIRSGPQWITSDNFSIVLVQAHYFLIKPPTDVGLHIAKSPLLCHILAALTVTLEICFPLALVTRRLRLVLVPGTLLMQIGIGLLMGVWFSQFLFLYLFWVPWERLGSWLARHNWLRVLHPVRNLKP